MIFKYSTAAKKLDVTALSECSFWEEMPFKVETYLILPYKTAVNMKVLLTEVEYDGVRLAKYLLS